MVDRPLEVFKTNKMENQFKDTTNSDAVKRPEGHFQEEKRHDPRVQLNIKGAPSGFSSTKGNDSYTSKTAGF